MPLTPGTRFGPYAVTAKIGEGGMGEAYRPRDTKLDRDVALKVLPQAFTDGSRVTEALPTTEGSNCFCSTHNNSGDRLCTSS